MSLEFARIMDFGALPPEINSGRMYAGPGSGSLVAAAAAWDGLAAELDSTAVGYASVIGELAGGPWLGPASRAMVAAATQYIGWLGAAAILAEEAGSQARVASAAFASAFAMTVPPQLVAANRTALHALVATNFFGQNTGAIAVTEAQYAEMWAQDATAMYGYAGASAQATRLTPFTAPAPTTDECGLVLQAAASKAGQSSVPWIVQQFAGLSPAGWTTMSRATVGLSYHATGIMSFAGSIAQQSTIGYGATAGAGGAWYATPEFVGLGLRGASGRAAASTSLVSSVAASTISTGKIGGLTVPASWCTSSGAAEDAAAQAVAADCVTRPHNGSGGLLRGIVPGHAGGRARAQWPPREYGFRHGVLARPPSAG